MNLIEINEQFPTEQDCILHLEKLRYGKKPKCAYCESGNVGIRQRDNRFTCKDCLKTSFVTVNTPLHGTKISIKTWFYAISIISDAKKGLSALQLQRNLNVSYPTAWAMYHKIREIMATENKEIELTGILEMDETFVGGKPRKFNDGTTLAERKPTNIPELNERIEELKEVGVNFKRGKGNPAKSDINPKRGRGTSKYKVAGIVERGGNVVAEVMKDLSYEELKGLVKKYVDEEDSVMITDEMKSYSKFNKIIEHVQIDHQRLYSYKGVNTNSIESFWAIIKRGIIGQYHQVSAKHLPKYIAEFVFKYNNRNDDDMFETLLRKSINPNTL